MSWSGPGFVLGIIALSTIGMIFTTWIQAHHGHPIKDDDGATVVRGDLGAARTTELLKNENERLHGQVSRLEERIAVLERIATDPAERVAREIDALR